jgi:hypothetical protein
MKTRKTLTILFMVWLVPLLVVCASQAAPMGTAWTYQGRLMDANVPADGLYDLQFKLYDVNVAGTQKEGTIEVNELDVINGLFTVLLDFGSGVFDGNAVWLEIGIRPGKLEDPNAYTTLSPRYEITPTPYTLYALQTSGLLVSAVNTFVGKGAGTNNKGNYNTFSGMRAGHYNTAGSRNTFFGAWAGLVNTAGNSNTFLGAGAGQQNTTGNTTHSQEMGQAHITQQPLIIHSQDTRQATPTQQVNGTHSQDTRRATPTPQAMGTHSQDKGQVTITQQVLLTHSQESMQATATQQAVLTHS